MSGRAGTALMSARCPQERGHPGKAGGSQQCQERTLGKSLMRADMTLAWMQESFEEARD